MIRNAWSRKRICLQSNLSSQKLTPSMHLKYLGMKTTKSCNMHLLSQYVHFISQSRNTGNIFWVSHILQLINNSKIWETKEKICRYCTRQRAIATLSLNDCWNETWQEFSSLLSCNTNLVQASRSKNCKYKPNYFIFPNIRHLCISII